MYISVSIKYSFQVLILVFSGCQVAFGTQIVYHEMVTEHVTIGKGILCIQADNPARSAGIGASRIPSL